MLYFHQKLLQTLNEVKASSTMIDQSLRESTEVKQKLMLEYDQFRDICHRSAKLFIGINQNYNLSVAVFTSLYVKSIEAYEVMRTMIFIQENHDTKLLFFSLGIRSECHIRPINQINIQYAKSINTEIGSYHAGTANLSSILSRSGVRKGKTMLLRHRYFDLIISFIYFQEWESFMTNFMSGDETASQSIPDWIPKTTIPKIVSLQIHHADFYQQLNLENENLWSSFVHDVSPSDVPVPLSEFRKILITQLFRPDLLTATLTRSLTRLLGTSIPSESKPSIQQLLDESSESEPIVFITSGEIDPSKDIQDYARKQNYTEVAIGRGQEQNVTQQIRRAGENGHWICVKNVQLVPKWLNALNETLQTMHLNSGFRLWLICDSSKHFPPSLLAKCKTVLYEPPNSIRSKVLRLIQQWNAVIDAKKDTKVVKLYVALFMFNAVLQERRSYIPQGWTTWYEFADSDLKAAIDIIGWIEKSLAVKMDWTVLRRLINAIAYGGRISNPQDSLILTTNLDEFFDAKVLTNTWSPLNFNVNIPMSHRLQDYCNIFMKFPDVDRPEAFGLSASTLLMKDKILCKNILKNLRSTYESFQHSSTSIIIFLSTSSRF